MSGRVVPLGTDMHTTVQTLLPWYVNSRLDEDERARVQAHLTDCPRCRTELEWERKLQAAQALPDIDTDASSGEVERGLAILRSRVAMDQRGPKHTTAARRLRQSWRDAAPWLRWAMVGQCAAIAALSVLTLMVGAPGESYRTLGTIGPRQSSAAAANLVVRFRPDATEQELRRALKENRAQLVYGPTTTDAYLLNVPAGQETAVAVRLRKEPIVLMVESLNGAGAR